MCDFTLVKCWKLCYTKNAQELYKLFGVAGDLYAEEQKQSSENSGE